MERCIFNHIIETVGPKITDSQFGFLSGRSTDTQMLTVFSEVDENVDSKLQTDMVYFDFSASSTNTQAKILWLLWKSPPVVYSLLD